MESQRTAAQVAQWMLMELKRRGKLHDDTLVFEIAEQFAQQFTYENENGNPAIRKDVLAAFANLSKDSVVWQKEDHYWRMRTPSDKPGRQQD
jgi:hypothetical protein